METKVNESLIPPCRNIILSGEITEEKCAEITAQIIDINAYDEAIDNIAKEKMEKALKDLELYGDNIMIVPKLNEIQPIYLYIDSGGGCAYSGIGLSNLIENSIAPVITVVTGKAMSIALLIAMSGKYRMAYKNSSFMFHDVSFGIWSDSTNIKRETNEADRIAKVYMDYICENSYIENDKLKKFIDRRENWYFSGLEAEELGVVDELIDGDYEENDAYDTCECCGEEYGDCECDE